MVCHKAGDNMREFQLGDGKESENLPTRFHGPMDDVFPGRDYLRCLWVRQKNEVKKVCCFFFFLILAILFYFFCYFVLEVWRSLAVSLHFQAAAGNMTTVPSQRHVASYLGKIVVLLSEQFRSK